MKYRIHYYLSDEDETRDSIVVEGATLEEIQLKTAAELERRGAKGLYSEKLS